MNARLYDPRIASFLSPDNLLTDPSNPQNYNRYSYALNNPLIYTDPSGNSITAALLIYSIASSVKNIAFTWHNYGASAALNSLALNAGMVALSYATSGILNTVIPAGSWHAFGVTMGSSAVSSLVGAAIRGRFDVGDFALSMAMSAANYGLGTIGKESVSGGSASENINEAEQENAKKLIDNMETKVKEQMGKSSKEIASEAWDRGKRGMFAESDIILLEGALPDGNTAQALRVIKPGLKDEVPFQNIVDNNDYPKESPLQGSSNADPGGGTLYDFGYKDVTWTVKAVFHDHAQLYFHKDGRSWTVDIKSIWQKSPIRANPIDPQPSRIDMGSVRLHNPNIMHFIISSNRWSNSVDYYFYNSSTSFKFNVKY